MTQKHVGASLKISSLENFLCLRRGACATQDSREVMQLRFNLQFYKNPIAFHILQKSWFSTFLQNPDFLYFYKNHDFQHFYKIPDFPVNPGHFSKSL